MSKIEELKKQAKKTFEFVANSDDCYRIIGASSELRNLLIKLEIEARMELKK